MLWRLLRALQNANSSNPKGDRGVCPPTVYEGHSRPRLKVVHLGCQCSAPGVAAVGGRRGVHDMEDADRQVLRPSMRSARSVPSVTGWPHWSRQGPPAPLPNSNFHARWAQRCQQCERTAQQAQQRALTTNGSGSRAKSGALGSGYPSLQVSRHFVWAHNWPPGTLRTQKTLRRLPSPCTLPSGAAAPASAAAAAAARPTHR